MEVYNCIYKYTNKINNKIYIGQTKNMKIRHREHTRKIRNFPFSRAIQKYGMHNFNLEILKQNINNQCSLNLLEFYYIEKYESHISTGKGYNVAYGGSNGALPKEVYKQRTEKLKSKEYEEVFKEMYRKISESQKGMRNSMYGKRGKDCPSTKTVLCIHLESGQNFTADSNPLMAEEIKNRYGIDIKVSSIANCCRNNKNGEVFESRGNNTKGVKNGFKFYYLEDYKRLYK